MKVIGLRAGSSATSAVATLSVAVAMGGHVLVAGGPVPVATVPQPAIGSATRAATHGGMIDALTMTAAHLAALLIAVALLSRAHQWTQRIRRILARLLPQHLPAGLMLVPAAGRLVTAVPGRLPMAQRWLPSNVSRRGPPAFACTASS
jgi:hypothetical protein